MSPAFTEGSVRGFRTIQFNHNGKEFKAHMDKLGMKVFRYVRASYAKMGRTWVKTVKLRASAAYTSNRNTTPPYSGPTSNARLQRRTGGLANSIKSEVKGDRVGNLRLILEAGGATGGRWGGAGGYAHTQEYGGTIKGKPWLLIPLDEALTPKGRVRKEAQIIRRNKRYTTRGFGPTFIRDSVIFAQKQGAFNGVAGRVRPLYLLRRQVKIPPRLGARGTMMNVANRSLPKMGKGILRILLMDPVYPPPADGS